MLICDTSGLIAAWDDGDKRFRQVLAVVEAEDGPYVVSPLILAEFDHLARKRLGPPAARRFAREVAEGRFELASWSYRDHARATDIDELYRDLDLGLADASLVVLAERYRTRRLLTFDERHFRAVAPLQGGSFTLLPTDGG